MDVTSPYVFISYAHNDTSIVTPLVNGLKRRGVNVWWDIEQIPEASQFNPQIANAIHGCCCMILFLSASYQDSNMCDTESSYGMEIAKPRIPVKIEDFTLLPHLQFKITGTTPFQKRNYANDESLINALVSNADIMKCIPYKLSFENNESIALRTARWLKEQEKKELSLGLYKYLAFESMYAEAQFELAQLCYQGTWNELSSMDIIGLFQNAATQGHEAALAQINNIKNAIKLAEENKSAMDQLKQVLNI